MRLLELYVLVLFSSIFIGKALTVSTKLQSSSIAPNFAFVFKSEGRPVKLLSLEIKLVTSTSIESLFFSLFIILKEAIIGSTVDVFNETEIASFGSAICVSTYERTRIWSFLRSKYTVL